MNTFDIPYCRLRGSGMQEIQKSLPLKSFDPDSDLKAEQTKKGFACGRAAVVAAMWAGINFWRNQCET